MIKLYRENNKGVKGGGGGGGGGRMGERRGKDKKE